MILQYPKMEKLMTHKLTENKWRKILKHAWNYSKKFWTCTINVWHVNKEHRIDISFADRIDNANNRSVYIDLPDWCYLRDERTIDELIRILWSNDFIY